MCNGVDIGFSEEEIEKKAGVNGVVVFDVIGNENIEKDNSPFGEKCRECLRKKGLSDCPRKR